MADKDMDVNIENDKRDTGAAEAPLEVTVTRKRKKEKTDAMDTDDSPKKPNFPPVPVDAPVSRLFLFVLFCFWFVS